MPNIRQSPKPSADISDYEWSITPTSVKIWLDRLEGSLASKQQDIDNLYAENQWLKEQLNLRLEKTAQVAQPLLPEIMLWAMVGLILTIGGTFVEASTISAPWLWENARITTSSLGVTYQIGAVLLTGCLGGRSAALMSQTIYIFLGLLGLPVFDRGGGLQYFLEPSFGYLLGFVLGAWICGYWAFRKAARVDYLFLSCCLGLASIHAIGIAYFTLIYTVRGAGDSINSWFQGVYAYSIAPMPGQLAVLCATVAIAYLMRKLMLS